MDNTVMDSQDNNYLPFARRVYWLALVSCTFSIFGGFTIVLSILSLVLARKTECNSPHPLEQYSNYSTLRKGKIIAYIGLILNALILAITIWTLTTIGWEAWSEEFIRRWNEGLNNGQR